jgi:zinc protease
MNRGPGAGGQRPGAGGRGPGAGGWWRVSLALVPATVVLVGAAVHAQVAPAPSQPATNPAAGRGAKPAAVPGPGDLKYPPLRPMQTPSMETVTLPNGMRLYLLEDHELPLIAGLARIRTGTLFDPPDRIGLGAIAAAVLRTGGTRSQTGDQINQQLENLAATVESGMNQTSGAVSFSALKESADRVLEVFRDLLTAPEFRQDKIDLQKAQVTGAIARRNDDAGNMALREFGAILYGKDTPYGWLEQYDTIARISRADVQNLYRRYYFPKNVMLAVWGDFDTARMKAMLTELFAGWTAEQPPVPEFPKVKEGAAPGVYLTERKDVRQTFFAVGHLGGQLNDKDYPALEIAGSILGGAFHSRLVERTRTRLGNAYDISAQWGADFGHPGLFQIAGSANPVSSVDTLKAIREEVERMRAAEVTEDELRTAKEAALNRLVFALDTKAKILARLMSHEYYGYPKDFIQQYQKGLTSVTRADVRRVAKERFDPANLTIVVVANPVLFGQPLDSLNPLVNQLDVTIPEAKPQATKGDEAGLAQGKQILLRAQQAAGTAQKLAAVKDYTEVAEFLLTPEHGGMKVVQTDRWIGPTAFRQDSTLQAGRISAYFDGRIGWISTPQGFGALGGSQLKQVQGDLFRLYFRLMLSDQFPERTVNALESNTVEISDPAGQIATVEFDAGTGLPQRVRYDLSQATGAPVMVMEEYHDFHDIAGVKIPHQITITRGGQKFADVTVTEYKVNSGLQVTELMKRP